MTDFCVSLIRLERKYLRVLKTERENDFATISYCLYYTQNIVMH